MLIFQIKRIISREKWLNYAVTFFFVKMPKIWVGRTLNGEKERMALPSYVILRLHEFNQKIRAHELELGDFTLTQLGTGSLNSYVD